MAANFFAEYERSCERTLLATCLLHKGITADIVRAVPCSLITGERAVVWNSIVSCLELNKPVDSVNVFHGLRSLCDNDAILSRATMALSNCFDGVYCDSVDNWQFYLSELKKRRAVAALAGDFVVLASEMVGASDVEKTVEAAEGAVGRLKAAASSADVVCPDMVRLADEAKAAVIGRIGGGARRKEIRSGLSRLDGLLGGFRPGQLVVIAGRPSMGKTSVGLHLARTAVRVESRNVVFFSYEMCGTEIMERLVASDTRINSHVISCGLLNQTEAECVCCVLDGLANSGLVVMEAHGKPLIAIEATINAMEPSPDMVVIDYLQLMPVPGRFQNRNLEISALTRDLKNLAQSLGVPVVVLSQLSRAGDQRGSKERRPILSDLRDSGAIEQDADVVIFVHREYMYSQTEEDRYLADLIVRKNRSGPVDTVSVGFYPETGRWTDLGVPNGG